MSDSATQFLPPVIRMRRVAVAAQKDASVMVAEEVDWTVAAGEFWVVGAPQHSGKSDFLMMTGGLAPPVGGEYFFFGERMPIFEEPRLGTTPRGCS